MVDPRPATVLDLNSNGIPDYKEPWFWRAAWGVFSFIVTHLAPTHTLVRRGVDAVNGALGP